MARASMAPKARTKASKSGAPARRTQAERSAETRRKIIEATIACMAQDGVRQTTMARIAERAGVTWGAIQHHFGDKAAIVFAGVEQGIDDIEKDVARIAVPGDTLPERVHRVVQVAWQIGYSGPAQRRAMQVFLTTLAELQDRDSTREHVSRMVASLFKMWTQVFADLGIPANRLTKAQRFMFALMSGLNMEVLITGRPEPFTDELRRIESILVDILTGKA